MKELKMLPEGIQTFEELMTNSLLYVDKTDLIYNLVRKGKKNVFLSRPRRFGKSLLVSTLKAYFEGRKELFEGLKISSLEQEWKKHPVLYFDFSGYPYNSKTSLETALALILDEYESMYLDSVSTLDVSIRFKQLIKSIYKKTNMQVVILVDEYDKPLLECEEYQKEFKTTYRNFFGNLKSCAPYIRFAFLTGVTKFSQVSIFSDLNNLSDITLSKKYSTLCGITQEELLDYFSPYIEELAEEKNLSFDECLIKLKDMYDGYHFCENSTGVYNPYSLINCFVDCRFDYYWYETGTPTFLVKMLLENNYDLRDYSEGFEYPAKYLLKSLTGEFELEQLLYQAGYLTIDSYNEEDDTYTLIYPNNEVKDAFSTLCRMTMFNLTNSSDNFKAKALRKALNNADVEALIAVMKSILAGIPYTTEKTSEEHFRNYIYLIFTMRGQNIICEERTSKGRIDLTLLTKNYIYIIEIKKDKDAQEALNQINENCYADKYALDERKVIKIGIKFSSEKRNIDDHRVG